MSTVECVADETMVAVPELDAARAAHAEAHAKWAATQSALASVEERGVLDGMKLDAAEREVAAADLRGRLTATATALLEKRERVRVVERADVAARLPELVRTHEIAAGAVTRERTACEAAYVELAVHGMRLAEAVERERRCVLDLLQLVRRVEGGQSVAGGKVPVGFDGDTIVTRQRPTAALFGLERDEFRPGGSFGEALGRFVRLGRRQLGDTSEPVGRLLHSRVAERLAELDAAADAASETNK